MFVRCVSRTVSVARHRVDAVLQIGAVALRSGGLSGRYYEQFFHLGHVAGAGVGQVAGWNCYADAGVAVCIAFVVPHVVDVSGDALELDDVGSCPYLQWVFGWDAAYFEDNHIRKRGCLKVG